MHELAMCETMFRTLRAEYSRYLEQRKATSDERRPRITRVRLSLGALHQVIPESFLAVFETLKADTEFSGAVLEIEAVALRVHCRACSWEGRIDAPFFICPRCGAGNVETISGLEFDIKEMELEDDEP